MASRDEILAWARKSTSLHEYFPRWIRNCTESARFLRSGAEYEAFLRKFNQVPEAPDVLEAKAQKYEQDASVYQQVLDELKEQKCQ